MRSMRQLRGSHLLQNETVRFIITGSSVSGLFYLATFVLIELGAAPFGSTLAAYAVAFVVSYSVQHSWTFRGRQTHARSFPRYLAAQLCAAGVAAMTARTFAHAGAVPAVTALASTLSGSALSYILSKAWVFAVRD